MQSLPLFHRIEGAPVVVVGDGEAATAKRRLIERAGGICRAEDDPEGARIAFVALTGRDQAEAAARRLKARGLLVNVADWPELCDFTLPSVLERGDVLVAVSTGGASAGLAKQLRLRLEALLPASLGELARGLAGARGAIRKRWADAEERRRELDGALAPGGPLDPLDEASPARIEAWLTGENIATPSQTVEIVLSSDDPDDLTLRQARLLGEADTILHDDGIADAVLHRARADAVRGPLDLAAQPPPGLTVTLRRGRQTSFAASFPNSSK